MAEISCQLDTVALVVVCGEALDRSPGSIRRSVVHEVDAAVARREAGADETVQRGSQANGRGRNGCFFVVAGNYDADSETVGRP